MQLKLDGIEEFQYTEGNGDMDLIFE